MQVNNSKPIFVTQDHAKIIEISICKGAFFTRITVQIS